MNELMLDSDQRNYGTVSQSMSKYDFLEQYPEGSLVDFDKRSGVILKYTGDYAVIDFNDPEDFINKDEDLIEEIELNLLIESMFGEFDEIDYDE